jgi:hypothetical protein
MPRGVREGNGLGLRKTGGGIAVNRSASRPYANLRDVSGSNDSEQSRRDEDSSSAARRPDTVTVRAISVEQYVLRTRGLRFPAPLIELASQPDDFIYWWSQLQFVFDVADPRDFGRCRASQEHGGQVLLRYVETARLLAKSTVVNGSDGVDVNFTRGEGDRWHERVKASFSAPDAIAGFSAYFRQLYAPEETASFQKAMRMMIREVRKPDTRQNQELQRWGRAVKMLRSRPIRQLLLERLAATGEWPALDESDRRSLANENPERIVSEYLYGEHLHWGKHAQTLEARKNSEFQDAWMRIAFLEAAKALSHLYFGFAVLVETAIEREPS